MEEEKWRLNAKSVFIVIMDILNVREWEGLKKRGARQSPSHLESILSFFVYIVEKEVGGSIDSLGHKAILKTAIHVNKHVHHLLNISIKMHMQVNIHTYDTLLK